jgi:hypothetical protein
MDHKNPPLTWGQLKQWAEQHKITDEAPVIIEFGNLRMSAIKPMQDKSTRRLVLGPVWL